MVFSIILIILSCVVTFTLLRLKIQTKRFAWALPYNCFLVITNPPEFENKTICYYLKDNVQIRGLSVQFNGCLVDIMHPNLDTRRQEFTDLRIPAAWIVSRRIKIQCFTPEAIQKYIKTLKNNTETYKEEHYGTRQYQ